MRELGRGGMGVVYEAHDSARGMTVALKTLLNLNAESLYNFKNEFRALADVHHPNLVNLYDLLEEDGRWFFTMEFLEGGELLPFVRGTQNLSAKQTLLGTPPAPNLASGSQAGNLATAPAMGTSDAFAQTQATSAGFDEERLRRALPQLAAGLRALHDAGKVHRDIKPSNIWVTKSERLILLDFGLAADATLLEEVRSSRQLAGTPFYMAPEQGRPGEPIGPAADWYAVGVILYEMLRGTLPHHGRSMPELLLAKESIPELESTFGAPLPSDLVTLCRELLNPVAAKRPTGPQVLRFIDSWSSSTTSVPALHMETRPNQQLFVGRRAELAILQHAFEASTTAAHALFVEGRSGLGKTALISKFLASASESGAIVLSGRCYAAESLPYKAFDSIVDALSRMLRAADTAWLKQLLPTDTAQLARLFPVLLRVPEIARLRSTSPRIASPQEMRSRAFAALAHIFRSLGASGPIVLFIDDLQWADADSLLLLKSLTTSEHAPPIFVVASVRNSDIASFDRGERITSGAQENPLAELRAERLALAPLSLADSTEIVARLLPSGDNSQADLAAITEEAGGHPLFLAELANYRARSGATGKLDDVLRSRIASLDAVSRSLLETVAVAGLPTPNRCIADACNLSVADAARTASSLRATHLIKTSKSLDGDDLLEPYHDRVRETLLSNMQPTTFSGISRSIASALMAAGQDTSAPESLVRHLLASGQTQEAADMAQRAAQRAHQVLAFDQAAEFLKTALRAGPRDSNQTRAIHIALAEALAAGGRGQEAAEAFLAAGSEVDDAQHIDFKRRAAEHLLASGHVSRGLDELRAVLGELGESIPKTPERALRSLLFHRNEQRDEGLEFHLQEESAIASRALHKLDVYQATSIGLILVDNVRGADFQARSSLLAQRLGEPNRLLRCWVFEAIYRAQEGAEGRASAETFLAAVRPLAASLATPRARAYITLAEAFLEYYNGRFRRAVEAFKLAEVAFRDLAGVAWEQNTIRLHRLRATDYQGAWGELRSLYEEYLADAQRRNDRYVEASITRWFNVLWLAHDEPDRAGADLDQSVWRAPAKDEYHLQHFLEVRARVELAFYRGDGAKQSHWALPGLDAAEGSMLFRIQIAQAIADWLRGRIAACEGDVETIEAMAKALDAQDINYARIWGGLLRGTAQAQRGDVAAASETLCDIADYADANDFPLCATIARLRGGGLTPGAKGAALVSTSLSVMKALDIQNPMRMADVFAPGFWA